MSDKSAEPNRPKAGLTHPSQQEVETLIGRLKAAAFIEKWTPNDPEAGSYFVEAPNANLLIQAADMLSLLRDGGEGDSSTGRASRGEWQPIETAPKDSTSRLVWCPENRCTFCASWGPYWIGDERREGWLIFGGGWRSYLSGVTHWQPLPAPPLTASKASGPPPQTSGEEGGT